MESGRPLRAVFEELAGVSADAAEAAALLREAGHGDLPDDLVADAIVNYAGTADVGVAEHLAPFVMAHTGATDDPADAADGLSLLASAPDVELDVDDLTDAAVPATETPGEQADLELEFGTGSELPADLDALDPDQGQFASRLPSDDTDEGQFASRLPSDDTDEGQFAAELPEELELPEGFGQGTEDGGDAAGG